MRTQDQVAAMQCPVCRVALAMSDRQGIEIDYCPQCRGVWLDRGELDKIIERSVPQAQPAPPQAQPAPPQVPVPSGGYQDRGSAPGYRDGDYDRSYRKPHKKHKSWLEEIFD